MKTRNAMTLGAVGVSIILAGFIACQKAEPPKPAAETERVSATLPASAIPITISASVPSELNPPDGAPNATMQQAAAFAWQEFIALNWPAVNQTGGVVNNAYVAQRDTPDNNCKFGDPKCTGPLVWETFRNKVEIFPGTGNPPGYPTVVQGDPSYGYDALPNYVYGLGTPGKPCDTPPPTGTIWINLDETDQISLDSMFAGVGPTQVTGNSSPQLVRFLAKANRTEYNYIAQNKWFGGVVSAVKTATASYLNTNQASPPPGSPDYVSLPTGTIEAKAGWRLLNPTEIASGRFKTATARYFENPNNPCYRQDTFGLVALHLIQKTASAPYFIYATFEQADNILTAANAKVEDEDGNINQPLPGCRSDQTAPCPRTPSVTLDDTATVSTSNPRLPPQVNLVPAAAKYCTPNTTTTPPNQLYYLNSVQQVALPSDGFICVNYRDNAIPQPVIDANQTAHAAIKSYNQTNGISDSPWLYYKLVNVQYQAINKDYAGVFTGNDPNSGQNPSSYHLANIVVETNRPLQLFSGGLLPTGSNSDYDSQFGGTGTAIHRNIYYSGGQLNMGGCMGCHGSQGQHQQGDFSVIVAKGRVRTPEAPAPVGATGAAVIPRNRELVWK
jgi:hypothetical protein